MFWVGRLVPGPWGLGAWVVKDWYLGMDVWECADLDGEEWMFFGLEQCGMVVKAES